jgi:TolA-binding protein
MLLLEMKQIKEGMPLLKSYISSFPGNPSAAAAQLRLAEVLVANGQNEEAVGEYQQYLETFTNSVGRAEASKGKGWALMNTERFAEAAMSFTKAYDLYKAQGEKEYCLFKAGDAQFANSQYKLASETYHTLIDRFPESALAPDAFFQLGESFVRSDLTKEAEESFTQLAQKYPTSPLAEEALIRVAQMKFDKGLFKEAIDGFTILMGKYPSGKSYAEALHGRGMAHYKQWHFAEALKDFDSILNKYGTSKVAEPSFFKRGICHYWLGRDDKALTICKEFLNKYPNSKWAGDVTFWIAKFEFNHDRYEEAEKNFIKFADQYKDHPLADDALLRAGLAASGRNEFVRSIEYLTRMLKEYPNSKKIAEARFAQGDALRQLAKFSAAILIFDEIVNKYPDSELVNPAWLHKGDCQFSLGAEDVARYKEAIGSYRVVANSSTANMGLVLKAEYMIGRSLEKLGRAVEAFEEQYYPKVMIRFFQCREEGIWLNESAKNWFVKAAMNSADILEAKEDWRGVVNILDRVVKAGVYASDEARERIKKIKSEHFWVFYQ